MDTFLVALFVGSAVLALWFLLRFPDKGPSDFARALLHVSAAILLSPMTTRLAVVVWNRGYPLAAIFGVLLPLLFYTFLSGAWFFRLATETLHRYRH
jgi:hypothetical protein